MKTARAWLALWYGGAIVSLFAAPHATWHHLERALAPSSLAHPFGCDTFGRDLLLLTLHASLASTLFAAAAAAAACALGIAGGAALALAGARTRQAGLRALEFLLAFPALLFALGWAAVRGPGWGTLLFALLIGTVPSAIRLLEARATEVLSEEYVLAARAGGAGASHIARAHLLPALVELCAVKAPNLFAGALMAEATLSFLGIGAPIGSDTWGSLLDQGKAYLIEAPHIAVGVGLPLVLTVLALTSSGPEQAELSS